MRTDPKGSTPGLIDRFFPFARKPLTAEAIEKVASKDEQLNDDKEAAVSADSDDNNDLITYPEGGLQAWTVAFGSWCAMVAGFGTVNTLGVFSAWISTHQLKDYDESTIAWIFGIYIFLCFFCGIQIGPVFDAKGPKFLIALGGFLNGLMVLLLGVCTQLWHFFIVISVIGGVGASLLFTPAIAAVAHWFSRRRGFATGLAATGGAVGGTIYPLMLQALLPKLDWGWSTRILGFIVLFMSALGVLLCKSRLPPKKGVQTTWRDMMPDLSVFNDGTGALAVTTAGIFFIEWGLFVPVTYLPSYYLARQGVTDDRFAFQLLAIFNGSSFFGRWIPGLLADKIGRFNTMILTVLLCVLSVFGLWLPDALALGPSDSPALIVVFAIVFGFASGSGIGLTPICVGELCETQEFGRYYATSYTIVSFSSLTGLPIAGALITASHQTGASAYWTAILFTGACYVVSLGCFVWVRGTIKGWGWRTLW